MASMLQLWAKHNTLLCQKEPNNEQKLFYINVLHEEAENWVPTDEDYEMFNQVYFQNASKCANQAAEGKANVLYGANRNPTSGEPQAEVLNMFINTQTERDII